MRFRYPLQKIVDLKSSEKSMAEWAYAAAMGRLREEERKLDELRCERDETQRRLEETLARPIPLTEVLRLGHYLEHLEQRIERQTADVGAAARAVDDRRSQLTDKMMDEKIWLKTREKAYARFASERLRTEQNELDEIALTRAAARA